MVAPALLAPPPFRAPAIVSALAFGVAASALRMAFGGHFLSDVLFGGLISLIVVFAVRWALWPRGGPSFSVKKLKFPVGLEESRR